MKIFLSGTSLDPAYGGPAYSVSRLATALGEAELDVGLWAPDGSALTAVQIPGGAKVTCLGGAPSEALDNFGKPDVIHDNGLWRSHNHALSELAAARGIPRIVSTRGMLEPWARNHKWLKKKIAWWVYQRRDLRRAAAIHATSADELSNLDMLSLGVPARLVPNGVDLPPERRAIESERRIRTALFIGRLYPVKGLPMLIEAWARVRPQGWRLVIAGPDEGGHRLVLERAIAEARLGESVSFPGPLHGRAKEDAFQDADFFVLPTHSESFGMAVAEALAHGLPVLTTTRAPWPALEERGCGWRVLPTVDGLAEGLGRVAALDSPALSGMGRLGRSLVESEYRWTSVAAQFVQLYEQVALDAIAGEGGIA